MATLPYQTLKHLCMSKNLITPWHEKQKIHGVTVGLSECGYDIAIKEDIVLYPTTLFNLTYNSVVGLLHVIGFRNLKPKLFFTLASTVQHFNMPDNLKAEVKDKSTWARQGLAVQNTVLEPGWKGFLTIELSNHGNKVLKIQSGTGIAQVIFEELTESTSLPYKGKYQNQRSGAQESIFE